MKLRDSPQERLKEVTLGLISHKSGPNVILGAFVTACLQSLTGRAPPSWAIVTGFAWALSVLLYAISDEIREQIEQRKRETLDRESAYRGIE